jgi:hypothetical protein
VFAVILALFTSAALSDFSELPNVEISGITPFILTRVFDAEVRALDDGIDSMLTPLLIYAQVLYLD